MITTEMGKWRKCGKEGEYCDEKWICMVEQCPMDKTLMLCVLVMFTFSLALLQFCVLFLGVPECIFSCSSACGASMHLLHHGNQGAVSGGDGETDCRSKLLSL